MELEFNEQPKSKIVIVDTLDKTDIIPNTVLTDYSQNTNQVIDMKSQPLVSDNSWMIKEVPYQEITEAEKKFLEGTKSATEIIEEEQKEIKRELTDDEKLKEHRKEYITKVKVLALFKCKHHPLSNPSDFSHVDKVQVINKMSKIINNYTEEELTEEFNKIIGGMLLDAKTKYENLPISRPQ